MHVPDGGARQWHIGEVAVSMNTNTQAAHALVRCIYTSRAEGELTREHILSILQAAREKNARLGITGMLLHDDGVFFQILEGAKETIDALFATISRDARHNKITKIIVEPIAERDFSDWTMGYAEISQREMQSIEGLNDFFTDGHTLLDLDEGRAKKLLAGFKEGRWRSSLSGKAVGARG